MKSLACSFAGLVCLTLPVLSTGCSSSASNSGGTATPLSISSISPAKLTAGAGLTSVTVTGSGFTSATIVQVGGVAEPTVYVSSTQLTASVAANQLMQGGMLPVIALNDGTSSGSGTSMALEVDNPSPTISFTVPVGIPAGTVASSVSVIGTGFVPTTAIQVGGSARSTSYVSPTQVNVILTTADLATGATLSLTAVNPAPGGGTSTASIIPVNNPLPGIVTVTPSTLPIGALSPTTLTVTGTNFLPASTVQVGGSSRPSTYVSATQLTFQLSVADQTGTGRAGVQVNNPGPGGGSSPAFYVTLAPPTPTPVLTQLLPNTFLVGSSFSTVSVYGSNLTTSSVILWNGAALATSYYSTNGITPTYLYATVPANLLASVGTANITVSSPTATPPVSNSLPVTIGNPPAPTLSSISPAVGPINTATAVSLNGSGFTPASTVAYNGVNLPVTFNGSNTLSVTLPAGSIATPGNGSFTVTTPAPGGGTTAPLVFTAYVPIVNNSMILNPANGLLYLSVPSSAGPPYGNTVVPLDPETGVFGKPIQAGSEPDKLALTSDGRYLWVGLDGGYSVRKIDLTANTAGLQFPVASGIAYSSSPNVLAVAALPGATDSVVVIYTNNNSPFVAIFDSGVVRGSPVAVGTYYSNSAYALQVDGSKGEIYLAGSTYQTYTYSASGVALKVVSPTATTYATSTSDEVQLSGGELYTDFGRVFDPESGSLLGSFYNSGSTLATGPTYTDAALGRSFILDNVTGSTYPSPYQIQVFNSATFAILPGTIPVAIATPAAYNASASRLVRWGSNGLAFRNAAGVYSVRSNLVKDLSGVSADLGVTVAASGAATTGSNMTYTVTVTNAGPSPATNVGFTALPPSTGVLVSMTSPSGSCSISNAAVCDLGGLANGGSATVTLVVEQTTAGSSVLTVQVSGSENDPVPANNQATSTSTITGSVYNLAPSLTSIIPAAIVSGSQDTAITLTGTNFVSGAAVMLGSMPLQSTFTSSTKLVAVVPAAQLSTLGWAAITVSNPGPGGGASGPAALTVYSVLAVGINRILYDPYSRKIMASVGSGSNTVTGNSIAAITPETATIGPPVSIGSQPTGLALSGDGQILYAALAGSNSIARFNMLTQLPDYTYALTVGSPLYPLRGVAVQPGTENTIAVDLGPYNGIALLDFSPATKSAAVRGVGSSYDSGCPQFVDAADLLASSIDSSSSTLLHYTVSATGLGPPASSTLYSFGCFKLGGSLAYAVNGAVVDPSATPARQLGTFSPVTAGNVANQDVAPDTSLQRTFFATVVGSAYVGSSSSYVYTVDSIEAFDNNSYAQTASLPLPFAATEGSATYGFPDLIRWGQDGLAALSNTGHLYLLRGPVVTPQLLQQNGAATLTASSPAALTHGTGNTLLTLTGGNFVPGVAALWKGGYRTTTIVDATHVTVAIPASDLASAGTATITLVNPGAPASAAVTFTIN